MSAPDGERHVELSDEELEILPDITDDERDIGWGGSGGGDRPLGEDRPPHWG